MIIKRFGCDGNDSRELNYELVGFVNIHHAIANLGVEAVVRFSRENHPRHKKFYRPFVTVREDEVGKFFSIWFATKSINTEHNHKTLQTLHLTNEDVNAYRKDNEILQYDPSWPSYEKAKEACLL